jgi:hypothetical protein
MREHVVDSFVYFIHCVVREFQSKKANKEKGEFWRSNKEKKKRKKERRKDPPFFRLPFVHTPFLRFLF